MNSLETPPAERAARQTRRTSVTLAIWQLRQTWFLLLVTGIGIVCSVVIVCAVPLLSEIMMTAGLHSVLSATPTSSELVLDASASGLSTSTVRAIEQRLDPFFQRNIGSYLNRTTPSLMQMSGLTIASPHPPKGAYDLQLIGTSIEQALPHLTLLQGRLPRTANGEVETLLTPSTAQRLHVTVGSVIALRFYYATRLQGLYENEVPVGTLHMRIVGLFTIPPASIEYWHGNDFQYSRNGVLSSYTLLVPQDGLLAAFDAIAARSHGSVVFIPQGYEILWYYHLDVSHIMYSQLDDLANRLAKLQADITNAFGNIQDTTQSTSNTPAYPYLTQVNLSSPAQGTYEISDTLNQYRSRISVFSIPSLILTLQILGIILFFVSVMADILVDRQATTIAILHSRGASNNQVLGPLVIQSIGLGLIALLIGLPLAIVVVSLIASRILVPTDTTAISLVTGNLVQAVEAAGGYAVVTVLTIIIVMYLLLRRAVSMDILSIRREIARSTRRPLWQRYYLDVVAAIIALTGYGILIYLTSIGKQLDIGTKALFAAPLMIVSAIFLLIGIMILFLRIFPLLLRLGALIAIRGRSAAPMLALAQLARAPRYSLRMTMILALTIAFAIFTLVFSASQAQRSRDISVYESGADFSGDIAVPSTLLWLNEIARYNNIPGVSAASVGYTGEGVSSDVSPPVNVEIRAVDNSSFAQTAIWTNADSPQSLSSLMNLLFAHRNDSSLYVPAIVDAAAQNALNLQVGSTFSVNISSLPYSALNCMVVGEVQHIPTVNSSTAGSSGFENVETSSSSVGILVDYATYAITYQQDALSSGIGSKKHPPVLPINHAWLRTKDDPAALAHVRAALSTPGLKLVNLYDRRALEDAMSNDPLYLNLIIVLSIGAAAALLLALLGDLLMSWLSVRTRLTNFVVLRAQGATFQQVASVLTWEQAIVYATALLLGIVLGGILSAIVVPSLVFTSIPRSGVLSSLSSSDFDIIQQVIPVQIVVPLSLGLVLLTLIIICVVALGMMVRVVLQPSMSQMLRLNED